MTENKNGAARSNRTTPARTSNRPAGTSRTHSIARRNRRAKYQRRRLALLLVLAALVAGITYLAAGRQTEEQPVVDRPAPTVTSAVTETPTETAATETEQPEAAPRYALSNYERDVVERVVMAEAGGESYEGQMLVAQCILNAAEKTGTAPSEAVVTYQYTSARPDPTQSVRDAVAAVFDDGDTVTDEPVMYFYNPARVTSAWHESQIFVIEVGGHRFFAERSATDGD
nr:MAG TPA: spore cortex-lytic enzyme [Caudoviricetes sp.]